MLVSSSLTRICNLVILGISSGKNIAVFRAAVVIICDQALSKYLSRRCEGQEIEIELRTESSCCRTEFGTIVLEWVGTIVSTLLIDPIVFEISSRFDSGKLYLEIEEAN
jgi:hypothetical protein